jgi:hypothetical protein
MTPAGRHSRHRMLAVAVTGAVALGGCFFGEGGDLDAAVSIVNETDHSVSVTYDTAGLPEQTILTIAPRSGANWQVPGPDCWNRVLVARDESGDPIELLMPPICNDDEWVIDGIAGG